MTNENQSQPDETKQSENSLDKQRERHKEISVTVRRTMFALLAYSASCGVIIAQPDVPFVLTSSGVQIPVINVAVNLNAFLLVGPIGLIAITTYLHLFLTKLDQITGLDEYDKQPFLFNFKDRLSRLLGFLIFYMTPILLMVGFSWKSAVSWWRHILYLATMVVTVGMLLLYIKSRLKLRLRRHRFTAVIFNIICIVSVATTIILSFYISIHLIGDKYLTRNLNLERAQLTEAKLTNFDLSGANLQYADLIGANLRSAFLSGADLRGADLIGADLFGAFLNNAILFGANLSKANFIEAYLEGAKLHDTIIDDTTQLDPKWQLVWELVNKGGVHRNLRNDDLERAYLSRANLSGADLSNANLRGANLSHANLIEANLSDADLSGADLRGASLSFADLRGATLIRANLNEAIDLFDVQLCMASTLYETKLNSELEKQVKERCPDLFILKERKE